jgi:pimeloyl-ACP methyl ester carboxylesterase
MAGMHTGVLPQSRRDQVRPRSPVVVPVVMAAEGMAFAALLGLDGSPPWQKARVLVTLILSALTVWYTGRAGRTGQGATALILGIVGTAAGAGVTGAHLAKAGLDAAAILAGIVLVTGAFLLIWGAVALVRAIPGWWRLLAIPAAVLVLWFVLFPLLWAVIATNRPPGSLGPATPASYGLTYHNVALRTADGVRLSAWYIPARNGGAAVLLPGAGSTRTAVLPQAAVLARQGYGALLVDGRGHGLSGGHAMDFGWWGSRDTAAAVSFLTRQPGIRPGKIAVVGESMGGEQALAAAGTDPRIGAVVAEGVTGQQLADHGWLPQGLDGALQRGMEWVMYTAAGLLSGAARPISIPDAIRAAAPRPELIIAGGAVADEPVAARWFQAASPATVHVWVVPHAGHTQGLATAPMAWETHVISFLNAALHPAIATNGQSAGNNG